jgi:glutamate-5-semialdehyde dehydrogenase
MVCITKALTKNRFDKNIVQLVETTDRKAVGDLISMDKYIDVIIPRGGKGLIEKITTSSKIPVIKHLDGNCHIYIDKTADVKKAMSITVNSKTQRYGVCNAAESLLIHKSFSKIAVKNIVSKLKKLGVEIRGCKNLKKKDANIVLRFLQPLISTPNFFSLLTIFFTAILEKLLCINKDSAALQTPYLWVLELTVILIAFFTSAVLSIYI